MVVLWVDVPRSLVDFTDISEVLAASITLMMVAASTSETSVNSYQTKQHNNPEDSHLYTQCHENLKSHCIQ
jgi:hypothetical protein